MTFVSAGYDDFVVRIEGGFFPASDTLNQVMTRVVRCLDMSVLSECKSDAMPRCRVLCVFRISREVGCPLFLHHLWCHISDAPRQDTLFRCSLLRRPQMKNVVASRASLILDHSTCEMKTQHRQSRHHLLASLQAA